MNLRFSIIIPSYNEGDDIRLSIESALNQDYLEREILVIDDSHDNTPSIIQEYERMGVRLIKGKQNGCCGARNFGIETAIGDIVVLLNADVVLPKDFLNRLAAHYHSGADYVLVESLTFNTDRFFARFTEMQYRNYEYARLGEKIEWTEGFSARREALLKIGLIPGNFKLRFCRDWLLGLGLKNAGFKKVIDRSIVVSHKSPDNFKEYWMVRKARGRFGALMQYFLYKKSISFLIFKFIAKDVIFILRFLTILPSFTRAYKISNYPRSPFKDVVLFWWAYFLQELARAIGEWEGIKLVIRNK